MNAHAQTLPAKVPVRAGGNVAALIPQSMEEAFRVANAIAASGLAPKGLDKAEQILVAIMAGAELGLAPFQALQSIAVINGRPAVWGDGLMAIVRSQGFKVREWIDGDADAMVARCEVTRPDNGDVASGAFSVQDARKAGLWGKAGPWQTYPKRMLQMRARAFALRDGAADVLRGFQIREEVEDYQPIRDVTPQATGMRARLEARTPVGGFDADHVTAELDAALDGDRIPDHDPQTGEIIDAVIDPPSDDGLPIRDDTPPDEGFPGDRPAETTREASGDNPGADGGDASPFGAETQDPLDWAADVNRALDAAATLADIDAVTLGTAAGAMFEALKTKSPALAKTLDAAVRGKRKALADKERQR